MHPIYKGLVFFNFLFQVIVSNQTSVDMKEKVKLSKLVHISNLNKV